MGLQQVRQTQWRESGASACSRGKKCKAKKAQEIREDRTQRADAIRPEAGSVRPEKQVFLMMKLLVFTHSVGFWCSTDRLSTQSEDRI